jgi:hypothetical protein
VVEAVSTVFVVNPTVIDLFRMMQPVRVNEAVLEERLVELILPVAEHSVVRMVVGLKHVWITDHDGLARSALGEESGQCVAETALALDLFAGFVAGRAVEPDDVEAFERHDFGACGQEIHDVAFSWRRLNSNRNRDSAFATLQRAGADVPACLCEAVEQQAGAGPLTRFGQDERVLVPATSASRTYARTPAFYRVPRCALSPINADEPLVVSR